MKNEKNSKKFPNVYLVMSALIMIFSNVLIGQEIKKYENSFREDVYKKLLIQEEQTIELSEDAHKVTEYLRLATGTLEYNDKLSLYYALQASSLSETIQSDSLLHLSYLKIAVAKINIGDFDEAASYLDSCLIYWANGNNAKHLSQAHIFYAYLERSRGNAYKGIEHAYEARTLLLSFKPLHELGDVTNRLVIAYSRIGDDENVVKIGEEYIEAFSKTDKSKRRARNILYNMHSAHLNLGNFERADEIAEIVIPLFLDSARPKTRFYGYSFAYNEAKRNKKYELAKKYSDSTLMMAKKTEINELLGDAYFTQYEALKNLNRSEEAFEALKKLRPYSFKSNRKTNIIEMAEAYSSEMAARGKYKKAYEDLYLTDSLRKEIFKEDIADKVRNLEKKIIEEENQKQVTLLNDRNEAIAKNLEQEKNLRYLLLGILGISVLSALSLWNYYNQRKKLNKLLIDKNKKLGIALEENKFLVKEVHHRVKNNMQVIASLLNLQSRVITNEKAKEAIVASKSRIISMSLLHKNIYGNENLKSVNLQIYFSDLLDSLDNTYSQKGKNITIESDIDSIEVELDMAVHLGLVTNEIISNAYKHAFTNQDTGHIKITVKHKASYLEMILSDNGKGISSEDILNTSHSLGIRLINSFTKKLKADLNIDNHNGTTYSICIPMKNSNN